MLSQVDLVEIVERASSAAERLGTDFVLDEPDEDDALVNARVERWRQVVANGNESDFERRLALDGLDPRTVRRALGRARLAPGTPLPRWAGTLSAALEAATSAAAVSASCVDANHPIPFQELLLPFVHVARERLATRAAAAAGQLTEGARHTLERSLLRGLARVCASSFDLEFSIFRIARQSSFARLVATLEPNVSRELYGQFTDRMWSGGLKAFFRDYPVLARMVATLTDFWVDAVAEFLLRLDADRPDLRTAFSGGVDFGRIAAIETGLSDAHNHGRRVLAITLDSGLRLIYKPKDLGLEEAYFALLAWLNEHGSPLRFKRLRLVCRPGYGWVEYVEQLPCTDASEAERYYVRAGMLLAVIYALTGSDFHLENVVASGEQPVLVDLETLLTHRVKPCQSSAHALADLQLQNSVLSTGLLPQWRIGAEGRYYETSALSAVGTQGSAYRVLTWESPNTDRMRLRREFAPPPVSRNAVVLAGATLQASDYSDRIVHGFRDTYRLLLRERTALLAPDSPLVPLRRQHVRFIFRPTAIYARLLESALDPRSLADGADRAITFEALSRLPLHNPAVNAFWPLRQREQQALEQMDIPCFSAPADRADLPLADGETLTGCFTEPAVDLATSRIQSLSEVDLERQVALIRAALYMRVARGEHAPARETPDATPLEPMWDGGALFQPDESIQRALAIGEDLERHAVRAPDGSLSWIGVKYLAATDRFDLQPLGPGLYDGACGVALFFGALAHVTAAPRWRDLAFGATQALRCDLRDNPRRLAEAIGIGGGSGLTSIIYALIRIGNWLGDRTLIDDARRAAALITAEQIRTDEWLDVLSGSAGAILGLLALYEAIADECVLEQARACGRHLIERRLMTNSGHRTWQTANGKSLAGFSHGAAGIAYALLRLHAVAPDPAFREAALEAIAYERTIFHPEVGNWIDLRRSDDGGEPAFRTSWCHGAPGIALARLGALAILDTVQIREDIEIGLQTTRHAARSDVDQLCCGELGRAEALLAGGMRLSRPNLLEAARSKATNVLMTASRTGGFRLLQGLPDGVQSPGFFQGTAGIGFELLRMANPTGLPSVLLWE